MGGVFEEMRNLGFPGEVVEAIRDSVDCNIYFFGSRVKPEAMYLVLAAAILIAVGIFVSMNIISGKRRH